MGQALYRKWRPQTWDEVVGQDHIIQTLRNAVRGGRVAHAYLFAGPRGTGKTTTARLLAKAVNCLEESLEDRPCNACAHCQALSEGRFLDLIEIDAASNTSVEDVRDLRDKINFSPNEGRYKVYIVDEVHMLSTAAFNALLKTLEEPPDHAIFVLATTEVHKIPATVLSRCQRHEFRRLPIMTMIEYLQPMIEKEGLQVEADALEMITRQATGSLRDAISLLDQLASTGELVNLELAQVVLGTAASEAVRGVVQAMVEKDYAEGLTVINSALDSGADPRQFARQVVDYLRGLLLVRMGNEQLVEAPVEIREEMSRQAEKMMLSHLLTAIRAFSKAAVEGRTTWQTALPLELAFVEASGVSIGNTTTPGSSPDQMLRETSAERTALPSNPGGESDQKMAPRREETSKGGGTFQKILDQWREVLIAARRQDPRAQALLNSCRPLGIESGELIIGFSSDLLREKMEKGHNLSIASKALEEVLGLSFRIHCVLTDAWAPTNSSVNPSLPIEDGGMVATAVKDLGAHVVDVENLPPEGGS
ncbi:MAG TPA: DNA polymerase III subunit gamma/tau [Anaerolineae bacterium]|nr:DNA polymerase III subunit gamma/tau [Anaerolineae bacterium]